MNLKTYFSFEIANNSIAYYLFRLYIFLNVILAIILIFDTLFLSEFINNDDYLVSKILKYNLLYVPDEGSITIYFWNYFKSICIPLIWVLGFYFIDNARKLSEKFFPKDFGKDREFLSSVHKVTYLESNREVDKGPILTMIVIFTSLYYWYAFYMFFFSPY